jgi:hypothetical protein
MTSALVCERCSRSGYRESQFELMSLPAAGVSAGQGVLSSVALRLMRRRVNAAFDKWR